MVCGHIHHPKIEDYTVENQKITYLNSGDWVENLTALEYTDSKWSIYKHNSGQFEEFVFTEVEKSNKELFEEMLAEFNMMKES